VVQYLQLAHGGANPKLRKKSTLQALRRLLKYQLISSQEARVLTDGYIFQRTVEHFLQMMHYRQTYSLPSDPAAIHLLARRLGFATREAFLEHYQQHSLAIRAVYTKYIGGIQAAPAPVPLAHTPAAEFIRQHLARMDSSYANAFSAEEISLHASLAAELNEQQLVLVDAVPSGEGHWKVSVVAYDYLGELSLICGLMFVHGLDIQSAEIFTYENLEKAPGESSSPRLSRRMSPAKKALSPAALNRRKIVDVFSVVALNPGPPDWESYALDLQALVKMLQAGQRREARSQLAKRVGALFAEMESSERPLYPIEISIDNQLSEKYTALHIQTADTIGFLYEFTNALSLTHTYIARMVVQTG